MLFQQERPRGFGAGDRPSCQKCGGATSLIRRTPAVDAFQFEQQTFACRDCGHRALRVVDEKGQLRR
jgi:hypothetical protein